MKTWQEETQLDHINYGRVKKFGSKKDFENLNQNILDAVDELRNNHKVYFYGHLLELENGLIWRDKQVTYDYNPEESGLSFTNVIVDVIENDLFSTYTTILSY